MGQLMIPEGLLRAQMGSYNRHIRASRGPEESSKGPQRVGESKWALRSSSKSKSFPFFKTEKKFPSLWAVMGPQGLWTLGISPGCSPLSPALTVLIFKEKLYRNSHGSSRKSARNPLSVNIDKKASNRDKNGSATEKCLKTRSINRTLDTKIELIWKVKTDYK